MSCTTNYTCSPTWFTADNNSDNDPATGDDVVAIAAGPHAVDLNITCIVKNGDIQLQLKNDSDVWFTPSEASHTINTDSLVRLPRANMPDVRILASADAVFSIQGSLRS